MSHSVTGQILNCFVVVFARKVLIILIFKSHFSISKTVLYFFIPSRLILCVWSAVVLLQLLYDFICRIRNSFWMDALQFTYIAPLIKIIKILEFKNTLNNLLLHTLCQMNLNR